MLMLISAFLAGVAFVVLFELVIIYRWYRGLPTEEPKLTPVQKPVTNPKEIAEYCAVEGATESESCMFLNLVFHFLWREWRDSPKTRNYFIKKMNVEFKEMLLNKAAGKFMEQITVKDYYLGDSLPVIKNATIMKLDTKSNWQVPREIDVALDIEYSGGFIITLDVDLIFGKSASLTVKLDQLKGRLRLQFTRNPCTHWSFSFYDDPYMDINVESNFEGKNLPRLTSFISNLIRRSVKKKHTMPRYKVRYKPFFIQEKPQDGKHEVFIHNSLITTGKLDVEIVECTRLPPLPKGSHVYCTLSLDSLPWKENMPLRRSLWPVHEVLICRAPSGIIGIKVYQNFEQIEDEKRELVLIESVKPNSPASQVDVQKGDILMSVNNVDVSTIKQAMRLLKRAEKKFTIKLQRPPVESELIKNQFTNDKNQNEKPLKSSLKVSSLPNGTVNIDEDSSSEASVENQFSKEKPSFSSTNNDAEESFDYNSIPLRDEESDTEEFVNIVVHEIERELTENDLETRKLIDELKNLRRNAIVPQVSIDQPEVSEVSPILNGDTSHSEDDTDGISVKFKNNRTLSESFKNKFMRRPTKAAFNIDATIKEDSQDSGNSNITSSKKNLEESNNKTRKRVKLVETKDVKEVDFHEPSGFYPKLGDMAHVSCDWENISKNNLEIDQLDVVNQEDEIEKTAQRTSILAANQEPVWNEIFIFDVEKEHKFLNICVWGKCDNALQSEVLMGYVSIPLMELAMECFATSSRKNIQTFFLAATASRSTINRTYIRVMMPGLNLDSCNGDITIAYKYTMAVKETELEEEERKLILDYLKNVEVDGNTSIHDRGNERFRQHSFAGTKFYIPTNCDYCQNKVWGHVAFQCNVCAMVCHNRCIQNAQKNTHCTRHGVRAKPPAWQQNEVVCPNEELILEYPEEKSPSTGEQSPSRTYPFNIPSERDLRPGIKRNNYSPQLLRRKTSTVKQKLSNQDEYGKEEDIFEKATGGSNELRDSISTAAVAAKEAGRELFASLDEEQRHSNIKKKVDQLQMEIHTEHEKEASLQHKLDELKDENPLKQKIRTSLTKSEERSQALNLLMIQYCAALHECFTSEQPQQCEL